MKPFQKMKIGLAQQVEVPVTSPEDLSSMAGMPIIEGEPRLLQAALWSPPVFCGVGTLYK